MASLKRCPSSPPPAVRLTSPPRWVSSRGGPWLTGDIAQVCRYGTRVATGCWYVIVEARAIAKPRGRYTHRLLIGRVAAATARAFVAGGARLRLWWWDRPRRRPA